jgi:hypothetical protein
MINLGVALLIALSLSDDVAGAQNDSAVLPPADTSCPRATLETFINSCNDFCRLTAADRHFDRRSPHHRPRVRRILDCLDTSELPEYARDELASEAAVCLKEILDRVVPLSIEEAPDVETINAADGPEKLIRPGALPLGKDE